MAGTQSTTMPLINLTDQLYDVLDEMKSPISQDIIELERLVTIFNGLKIENVDLSKIDFCFDIITQGKKGKQSMKISRFVRYFFKNTFSQKEIYEFSKEYNKLKVSMFGYGYFTKSNEEKPKIDMTYIDPDLYNKRQDPKDPRSTFISLVTETYPHGTEEGVMKFMPSGLNKDEYGNYYKIIGKSETMFCSHLDTTDRKKTKTNLYEMEKDGDKFIITDQSSILGADDKAGVAVMLYMMDHNIPGVYYFFIGEERGCIGSRKVAGNFDNIPHLNNMKRCISFDRRDYYSVITMQMGEECCSDIFGNALSKELNKSGLNISLDPTGIYTDSACFMEQIPECTNVSVGYFSEHTSREIQNMDFLQKICKASVNVNWESLPTSRKVGLDEKIKQKYGSLITDFKKMIFYSEIKMFSENDIAKIIMKFEDILIDEALRDLMSISSLMTQHKVDPDIYLSDDTIKIEFQ